MDKNKADVIVTDYLQKIYGYAVKKCFSYDEAEELCAEIVHALYTALLKSDEIANTDGYVWKISERTYAKYVAARKRCRDVAIDDVTIPVYDEYPSEDSSDDVALLRREIAFLTQIRRRIVYLYYYEDRSVSFIAKVTGIPEGTVKWHLNKARNELKEGFAMERKIGKLGLDPLTEVAYGHSGNPGENDGPESYIGDKLNLNIVYSVYHTPRTREEIAEELGVTLVFIDERIDFLEENGFLVKTSGGRYTTYVRFSLGTYSAEEEEKLLKMQLEAAAMLAEKYVPAVREAVADMDRVYIPTGNRELFEAAAIFYGVTNLCGISADKDLSKYRIKTKAGGNFIAFVDLPSVQSDPEYKETLSYADYWGCGNMWRGSEKYPSVKSWAVDTRYSSREGAWQNNLYTDYEYLYEYITGAIHDDVANSEKFARLRERGFLGDDGRVNIMVAGYAADEFYSKIPPLDEKLRDRFADAALEYAMASAKKYPPQMQDLIISWSCSGFIGRTDAIMVMDILYGNGTFRPLTEEERVTSNLIMFSDVLPK